MSWFYSFTHPHNEGPLDLPKRKAEGPVSSIANQMRADRIDHPLAGPAVLGPPARPTGPFLNAMATTLSLDGTR